MLHTTVISGRFSGRAVAIAYQRPIMPHLGTFSGRGVIRQRATRLALLGAALAIASYAALIYSGPTCRIVAETASGDSYVLGAGDTLAEAMQNHGELPAGWRTLRFPGCVR